MKKVVLLVLLLGPVLLVIGCSHYSVVKKNGTAEDLEEVSVTWQGYRSSAGFVSAGSGKIENYPPARFPRTAVMRWRTPDGELHEETVDVLNVVRKPGPFQDIDLIFTITNDGVKVTQREP